MSASPATEMLPLPDAGRRFSAERTVRLGDVDTRGQLRSDAVARYLQDVASDDALDAALPNAMVWVVRRTMVRVDRPCTLNEHVVLTTCCTGAGRSWAERRTSVTGGEGGAVEAVSLWVQIDVESGRPARLGDEFFRCYGAAAAGRNVSSRLSLGAPSDDATTRPWRFRATDLDPFDHVNNAAHWVVAEELFGGLDRRATIELEYLTPVALDELDLLVAGSSGWLARDGRVFSALRRTPNETV